MTTLYIIRHAESEGNSDRRLCGHVDVDISEEGAKQLTYLSERFKNIHLDAVYTSPLIRARKTAAAINKYHGLEVIPHEGLIELCCGVLDGMKWSQIKAEYPEFYEQWQNEPYNFTPPEGETQRHLFERIWNTMLEFGASHEGKTVALSTHGGALRCFLCRLNGWPIEDIRRVGIVENTGVIKVTYDNSVLTLAEAPDASHLPEHLCTVGRQAEYRAKA